MAVKCVYHALVPAQRDRLKTLLPFQSPDAKRLAVLFAVVYF